jgi:hypothetical protein
LLKWFAQALGIASSEDSGVVATSWTENLRSVLDSIDSPRPIRPGLTNDMLAYVIAGDCPHVLQEVAQDEQIGQQLRLIGEHDSESLKRLYKDFSSLPVAVGLRWARLLEASITRELASCRMQFPHDRHWPEALLMNSAGCSIGDDSSGPAPVPRISAAYFEALLSEDGADPSALLVAAFSVPVIAEGGAERRRQMVSDLPGYADALDRHVEAIRPLVSAADAGGLHAIAMLKTAHDATLRKLARELAELATAASRQVRQAAKPLVRRCGEAVDESLRRLAVEAEPEQRALALRLIAWLAKDRHAPELADYARAAALADQAPPVQALISEWLGQEEPE